MADFLTKEERSRRMAQIRSRDTAPEVSLRKALHAMGFRYRTNDPKLPGRPDIVLPRFKAVVFVHGCFWHRHAGCNIATTPKSNTEFWTAKFDRNVDRDSRVKASLVAMGWRVTVVWECELASTRRVNAAGERLATFLRDGIPEDDKQVG
jgi:DNA mismatch endonuclease (patch repair protein)